MVLGASGTLSISDRGDSGVKPADTGVGNRNIAIWIPADGKGFGERAFLLNIILTPDHMDGARDHFERVCDYSLVNLYLRFGSLVGVSHDCLAHDLWSTHVVRDFAR
jgi:hypothetical protein